MQENADQNNSECGHFLRSEFVNISFASEVAADINSTHFNVVPKVFLGIPVFTATVYLSGTEELSTCLAVLSVKCLEFKISR